MSGAPAQRLLGAAWALLAGSSALYFLGDNEADNDLWMHLYGGRRILDAGAVPRLDDASYTAAGLPWVDHEWLTQIGMAALYAGGGSPLLWTVKLALALLTAWLLWLTVRRHAASPWARGAVMVLALAVMGRGYAVRPQVITYLGVAALLWWLDRAGRAAPGWTTFAAVFAAFCLWANAHGAVIAGLGILGLWAVIGDAPPAQPPRRTRIALLMTAVLAVCLNPYGPGLLAYIATELRVPHPISEWQPLSFTDPGQRPAVAMLLALAATVPFTRLLRRRWWWAALVALVVAMTLRSQRHTPLLALCAAAPLAEQAERLLARLAARTGFRLSGTATALVAIALVGLAAAQLGQLGTRLWRDGGQLVYEGDEYPVGAVRYLRETARSGNLALPLDWGGYLLWHAAPAIKVSLDGRFATVYPPAVVDDGFAFFRGDGHPAGARLLDEYPTSLVLVPRGIPTPLESRSGWTLLYTDEVAALYGRDGPAASVPSAAPRGRLAFP